jgi:predicted aspartyl protease
LDGDSRLFGKGVDLSIVRKLGDGMKQRSRILGIGAGLMSLVFAAVAMAEDFDTRIPMRYGNSATFYVDGHVEGAGAMEFMVDTGSGYLTINEQTLAALQRSGRATFRRDLRGVLADGRKLKVKVYMLDSINIGGQCQLHNVEAAVFPGSTRQILGLSALRKASPFVFSFEPPSLRLSNCPGHDALAQSEPEVLPQALDSAN